MHPACRATNSSLALMEFAGRHLINAASFPLVVHVRFCRPRSDLFCHHVMIAWAIDGLNLVLRARGFLFPSAGLAMRLTLCSQA
jgi:hypothetical protein